MIQNKWKLGTADLPPALKRLESVVVLIILQANGHRTVDSDTTAEAVQVAAKVHHYQRHAIGADDEQDLPVPSTIETSVDGEVRDDISPWFLEVDAARGNDEKA